ncbi:MAG TPA: acetylornithine/succinylornithine family transaminase [Clostridia bacterium]|jgi:acetylornithine/N-succinyldiaminopimelate aminotransferase|nr:acetylornithine/succinylornithine family transaminase [Clostridia bacterium]HQM39998.1 acetylornithine/succinylornithine family transaminase [Clostridia bacterium]
MNIKKQDKKYIANTYRRFDLDLVKGKKELLYSSDGKEYIDMGSGIAVNSFGVNDEKWKQAVTTQLNLLQHTSNLYYTYPQVNLAKLLCKKSGMKKVFFANSGAEANECAIKAARKYSFDKYNKDRHTIVTLKNSFHGRTITTLSATGQDIFHKDFGPFTEGFVYVKADNIEEMEKQITSHKVCAIMLELIQGEGGIIPLDMDFVLKTEKLCKENDVLLIIDEIQTGIGRTGAFYSYMRYGINPDIVTSAKGLGGGLPIGCALFNDKTQNVLDYGSHGSTFGGNPVCCAGAFNIVSRINNKLLNDIIEKEKVIREMLDGAKGVESVDGMGLMLAVKTTKNAKEIVAKCMSNGVLYLTAKDKIRMLPPLDINKKIMEKAIRILKEACEQ